MSSGPRTRDKDMTADAIVDLQTRIEELKQRVRTVEDKLDKQENELRKLKGQKGTI